VSRDIAAIGADAETRCGFSARGSGCARTAVRPLGATLCATEGVTMKRILIATDGSPGGHEAVEQGLSLAVTAGADATLLNVRKAPLPIVGDACYQRTLSAMLGHARKVVDNAAARAAELGVQAEGEILEGDAAERIVQLARLRDADVIVVGSRALGSVAGTLLGSVSQAVLHSADRPVLVVTGRPKERRAAA
jgi:nucleotide-binding universal stress UspA family protein